jgi:hypothetical protein
MEIVLISIDESEASTRYDKAIPKPTLKPINVPITNLII